MNFQMISDTFAAQYFDLTFRVSAEHIASSSMNDAILIYLVVHVNKLCYYN